MARFPRGLEPSIAEKVDIQPYWSFEDLCKLAIMVEKYSKGKRQFDTPFVKCTGPPKPYTLSKPEMTPKEAGSKDMAKAFSKSFPSNLMPRDALNAKVMGISKLIAQT